METSSPFLGIGKNEIAGLTSKSQWIKTATLSGGMSLRKPADSEQPDRTATNRTEPPDENEKYVIGNSLCGDKHCLLDDSVIQVKNVWKVESTRIRRALIHLPQ